MLPYDHFFFPVFYTFLSFSLNNGKIYLADLLTLFVSVKVRKTVCARKPHDSPRANCKGMFIFCAFIFITLSSRPRYPQIVFATFGVSVFDAGSLFQTNHVVHKMHRVRTFFPCHVMTLSKGCYQNEECGMENREWGRGNGEWGMENGEWENGEWGMGNGEWGMGNGEWGMGNGEWGMGNGEWGMGNGEWGMGNGEWGMGNGEWGMGNGEWGMGNGEWGMGNGEWGMGNGEWGMGNGEWGMGNGEWGMGNKEWGMENGEWE